MNCEQVEDRLSAYLDSMLAPDESRAVTLHLPGCVRCTLSLAELRQNDLLIAHLPRVAPSPALHTRIFSSPEIRDLAALLGNDASRSGGWTSKPAPAADLYSHPLVKSHNPPAEAKRGNLTTITRKLGPASSSRANSERGSFTLRNIAVAAVVLLTLVAASLTALSLHHQSTAAGVPGAIVPPAAGPGAALAGPLPAGTRFVFLRDEALWSTLVDPGNQQPERLTPANVSVADGWIVSPAPSGHTAGDTVAYIDLRTGIVHTIRSDSQQDTAISAPLLQGKGSALDALWKTDLGATVLGSLTWSRDANTLAFVGDPSGSGQTHLFLYSRKTEKVQMISAGLVGSISHLTWSQDSSRLAFELASGGLVSIFDYNLQDHGVLNLTNLGGSQGNSAANILTLAWSPDPANPAVTWSLGSIGNVSSVWIHYVGNNATLYPQILLSGTYVQALYSQTGDGGIGSWLVITEVSGQPGDLWRLDLTQGASLVALSQGKQISFASWSPDGIFAFYLDGQTNGSGNGYVVNVANGATLLLSPTVRLTPMPTWSNEPGQLAYSTGKHTSIVNLLNNDHVLQLKLTGAATNFSWLPASNNQLVVVLAEATPGIYLVNTKHNTSQKLDHLGADGPIQWTQIP